MSLHRGGHHPHTTLAGTSSLRGAITLQGVDVHTPTGWQPVGAGLNADGDWAANGTASQGNAEGAVPGGLRWNFNAPTSGDATLVYRDRPSPLPAMVTAAVTRGKTGPYTATGLDGDGLPVDVVATVRVIPGAPAGGVVVDRNYAELAAGGNTLGVGQQVWVAAGAARSVAAKLKAQGVAIDSTETVSGVAAALDRQGPGLAQVLFLAEAGAAAILAAGGAIVGLYIFARRRRYELAALAAAGLTRRTLLGAVLAEQMIVLAFGAVIGIGAGLAAAAVVLRDVPEFLTPPAGLPLSTFPPAATLAVVLAGAVAVTLAAAATASVTLVRGVRLDQLREAAT